METNNTSDKQISHLINEGATMLSQEILTAEKNSILIGVPVGLTVGLIAYCTATIFPIMYAFVVGIGAGIITAVLLFYFKFGKHLPKRVIPYAEDSLFLSSCYEPIQDITIEAYNIANGNPPVDFIMPKRDD